ncbi:AP-4 complex subunit epsilon-1-like [Periplaneta americana]|uniref:AP-4 complex subunit epsilon-1-like n=1 Tax=Periplaneta americana TaxID=6978 RepID=UPI0037E95419
MSGIFEKTLESIGSILSPLGTNIGLKNMLERCIAARTRREEEWLIRDCLRLVRAKLSEPSSKPSIIIKCLAFSIFSELCGYKAEFAYIHAVKLAQYGSLAEKKMGYLACSFLLHESDPLSVLLVNTILRDLTSKNIFVIAMALSASCHFIPPDQAPALLPLVDDKLKHPSEYIRSKAVIVLHHFHRRCPQLCAGYLDHIRIMLGDKDPGVVAHVLQFLSDVAQDLPGVVLDITPSIIQIQCQILDGKLPPEYTYRGLHAPWMQISIIRLLRYLKQPNETVYKLIQKTLQIAKSKGDEAIGAAIISECITTLVHHRAGDELLASSLLCVVDLMGNVSGNFRYAGLSLLELVLERYKLPLSAAQQEVVLSSLRHPDEAMKRRTLSLLCTVAEAHNAEAVCTQVADYVRDQCTQSPHDLVSRAVALTDKFPDPHTHWHIAVLIRLLPLAQHKQAKAIQRRIQLTLLEENGDSEHTAAARIKVLHILGKYSESKTVSTSVLEVYVWALSHFCSTGDQEGRDVLEKLVILGHKVLRNQDSSSPMSEGIRSLLISIIHAATHTAERCGTTIPSLEEFLRETVNSPLTDVYLRQTCREGLSVLPHVSEISQTLQRSNLQTKTQLDFTLSFLDTFVCKSLEDGAQPYQPKLLHVATTPVQDTVTPTPDVGASAVTPTAPTAPSPCPSPISSGTGSIVDFPRSESCSSEDSRSWSLRSPRREQSHVKSIWSREGRAKNNDSRVGSNPKEQATLTTSDSEMQHLASLLFKRQETPSQRDPLDDLLHRDFQKLSIVKTEKS